MFRIRHCIFETNSSSNDYYRDDRRSNDDLYDDLPKYSHGMQKVHIAIKFKDNMTEEDHKEVESLLNNFDDVIEPIVDSFLDIYDRFDPEDYYFDSLTEDEIILKVDCEVGLHYFYDDYMEVEYDYLNGIPLKGEKFTDKPKYIQKLQDVFERVGLNNFIVEITDFYGEDPDYDEVYDNINW